MRWLIDMVWLIWRCGAWLKRDVVAHWEMWWLIGRCGGSLVDVVAHWLSTRLLEQRSGGLNPASNRTILWAM